MGVTIKLCCLWEWYGGLLDVDLWTNPFLFFTMFLKWRGRGQNYVMFNHKREMQMYSLTACSLKRTEIGGGIVYKKREQLTEVLVVIFVLFLHTRSL